MNTHFLIAKVLGNHTEHTWAQVYSTLNLFIVIGLSSNESHIKSITTIGKELLERLQREFYALDEKTLLRIKESVTKAIDEIPEHISHSIVLATVTDAVVYIITAGNGIVLLKRADKFGKVAIGEGGAVIGFSGMLEADDILVLQTHTFSEKIDSSTLVSTFSSDISAIAENLTPIILQNPTGDEAALFVQIKITEEEEEILPVQENESADTSEEHKDSSLSIVDRIISFFPQKKEGNIEITESEQEDKSRVTNSVIPLFLIKKLTDKRLAIPFLIVLLLLFFGSMILFEKQKNEQEKTQQAFNTMFSEAQKKYDEGIALETLNANLALSNFTEAEQILTRAESTYPDGTPEKERLNNFKSLIVQKIQALREQPQPTP